MSIDELTRCAFIWAEQDRSSLVQCYDDRDSQKAIHQNQVKQLRAYRLKKWGRTAMEAIEENCKSVPLSKIKLNSEFTSK